MIDIQLLRLMRVRSDYNRIAGTVRPAALDPRTRKVMQTVAKYYAAHPSHGKIDFTTLIPFAERGVLSNLDEEDRDAYRNIMKNMSRSYPDSDTRNSVLGDLSEINLMHEIGQTTEAYNSGEDIDAVYSITQALDSYKTTTDAVLLPEVSTNVDDLLTNAENDHGIHWRLPCLNSAMRPLRGGDFGLVAARPDQGKTSFLASELTYMAPQLPPDRPIVWLNNEGLGIQIRPRLMQAALNCTMADLIEKKNAGTLYTEYNDAMGGENRIRVMDVHGYRVGQVEALIEETTPGILVYDMIDNIHGFGDAARTDLMLEKMYQWARERAVKYDTISIATSQISAEGAENMYPGLSMLKDSKTGKQGACDFQLMIGSQETKPEFTNTRWLSLPKNKLRKLNSPTLLQRVIFNKDKARYTEIEDK